MSTSRALLVLVLGPVATLSAQEPFFQPVHVPGPPGCFSIAAGDLDGDGDTDLVAGGISGAAHVLLNAGARTFVAGQVLVGAADDVTLADLDGNGTLDLAATDSFQKLVGVRLGNGDGTFGAQASYPQVILDPQLGEVEAADLDADGDLDLVFAFGDARLKFLLNDGSAHFTHAPDVAVGTDDKRIAAADFDNDGWLDLAVTVEDGGVWLYRGVGNAGFVADGTLAVAVPRDVAAADLTGDGYPDLVVTDDTVASNRLRTFVNDGSGSFTETASSLTNSDAVRRVVLADLDEDGALDAVATAAGEVHGVVVRLGASGAYTPAPSIGAVTPWDVLSADLDGDGDLDLATADFSSGQVGLAWGEGDGTFRRSAALVEPSRAIATADFNGDELPDLVAACDHGVAIALNHGNGQLPEAVVYPSFDFEYGVTTGDFDGDGDVDVVTANRPYIWPLSPPGGKLWRGNGRGGLLPYQYLSVPEDMQDVVAIDLDGNDDLDLVFAPAENGLIPTKGFVYVLLGLGDGAFAPPVAYATPGSTAFALDVGDFNGDGRDDVLANGITAYRLHVLLSNGDGTLQAPIATAEDWANDVIAEDFNGDGRTDAAFARAIGLDGPPLGVRLGNGDGTLGPETSFGALLLNFPTLARGDVDHDGILDLVVGHITSYVFRGLGNGGFELAGSVLTAANAGGGRYVLADFDGDGWDDLAVTKGGDLGAELGVLRNQHGPWNDLAHPLTGTLGLPRQTGEGTLLPGSTFRFLLRDARPLTTAFHVVGVSTVFAPLKGGVLVPAPQFISTFSVTDANGDFELTGPWDGFPTGLTLYFQYWLKDPNGPKGFSASNAISATMP